MVKWQKKYLTVWTTRMGARELLYVWEKKVCFQDKTTLNEVAVSLLFPPAKNEKNFIFTFVSGIQFSKKSLLWISLC